MMEVKVKYFNKDYPKLEKLEKGDFIDLRIDSIKSVSIDGKQLLFSLDLANKQLKNGLSLPYDKGTVIKFGLGVAMELPKGYEAIVVPRSSTFRRWGLIQTNSPGVIDNIYKGDSDEWGIEFIATRDGTINRFDRVCQFRIQKNQPKFNFTEVKHLGNKDRGGYGTTGGN